jgi:hypothetical protein
VRSAGAWLTRSAPIARVGAYIGISASLSRKGGYSSDGRPGRQWCRAKRPPGPGHFLGTSETPHCVTLALEGRSQSDHGRGAR